MGKKYYIKTQQVNKRKLAIFIVILLIIVSIISIFFIKNNKKTAKNFKIGNNTTSQEIVDNILNINSYNAVIEVRVKSNKNENKYIIKQTYKGEENNVQEIIEPTNIAGLKLIREGSVLKLENSKLNLTSLFENYQYISDNDLDLSCFIKEYKQSEKQEIKEKDNEILLKTKRKILYINKKTGMPVKMEIQDNNKNIAVYILYNEVNVNS